MQNLTFYLKWIAFNLIGFICGSYLGATDDGLISTFIPGVAGMVAGDLVFGSIIGFSQWLVLKSRSRLTISVGWIALTGIGFTLGARLGALLTYRIVDEWWQAGIVFGCFMGGSIGLATALELRKALSFSRFTVWMITSISAWVIGESIAFDAGFAQAGVPWVAAVIGVVTGLGLLWLWVNPFKYSE
ncbi:MAG: hypothetical protein ABI904_16485 [Chloroflexota bacterium]